MFLTRIISKQKYNIRHAIKVEKIYSNITKNLVKQGIYGGKRVYLRHKEIIRALNVGLITQEEYRHWKISHKVI